MNLAQHGNQPAVDRAAPQEIGTVRLLGVTVHTLDQAAFLETMARVVLARRRLLVNHVNTYAMNLAYETPWFRAVLNRADLVFCDGIGVKWGARLLGLRIPQRYTGPDWIEGLCEICVAHDLSLFLLGSQPGIAEKAGVALESRFPGLRIVGCHHGYFDKGKQSPENQTVIQAINDLQPDILLVGFGMPLQEQWLDQNWGQIQARVAVTVGALFDYVSGELRRAPRWMTNNGLEWLGRLLAEPHRLWRRYVVGNPLFLWRVWQQRRQRGAADAL